MLTGISAGLLVLSLFSCTAVHRNIPEQALIKLPEKKIVKFKNTSINKLNNKIKSSDNRQLETELKLILPSVEPVWIPPVIVKVLILPFVDRDNVLHGGQYVFAELKKGRWLFGNYLFRKPPLIMDPLEQLEQEKTTVRSSPGSSLNTGKPRGGDGMNERSSFFTGGSPHLPSSSSQFSPPNSRKGPPEAYREQFNRAVNSLKR